MRRKNTSTEILMGNLVDALLMLLEEKDYQDISIGEIADKAGVNRSTYYRNFSSKEDIIKFFYSYVLDEYVEKIKEKFSLSDYLVGLFSHFYLYKEQLLMLHKNGLSFLLLDSLNSDFAEFSKLKFESRFEIYYHIGGVFNTMQLWFEDRMNMSPKKITETAVKFLPVGTKPILKKI